MKLVSHSAREDGLGAAVVTHPGVGNPARPVVLVGVTGRDHRNASSGSVMWIARAAAREFDGALRPFGRRW